MMEPLTPPECDLRGLPFMPLDVVRLTDSDLFALATGDEFKAAVTLWCKSWLQVPAASLPDDDRILAHLSGSGARWRKLREIALRGFVKCADGRLYHPVIAEKAREAWDRREEWTERQNNKTERQKRWRDRVNTICAELRSLNVTPPTNASLSTLERLLVDARASTAASTGDAQETALTGTGTGTVIPFSNENGAQPDSDKAFWDNAKAYLGPKNASLIGKCVRDFGKAETASAITAAQLERAVNPAEFILGRLRKGGGRAQPAVPL
ncbi:MAG: DUF1376 domain-containing protein [Sphingomonas sp.]|uniref:DUF1376 domain-containing protein n=1 Tax=Sphingomonas sp. TaxID=28214 RepID=UPI001B013058|nr:DUF1376 domain-containing protein [Sphingomonas sp.]MBO9624151.1 DUF1376 domain-containing protein [Sphingomonas sp.]